MDSRLPAHVEVSGLIRTVQAEGGFAMVLARGEKDAGTILIVTIENNKPAQLYERMPQIDGSRSFICTKVQDIDNKHKFDEYMRKRQAQDSDSWIVELDIANAERFIETGPALS